MFAIFCSRLELISEINSKTNKDTNDLIDKATLEKPFSPVPKCWSWATFPLYLKRKQNKVLFLSTIPAFHSKVGQIWPDKNWIVFETKNQAL